MRRFANDPAGTLIATESGPLPSLAEWLAQQGEAIGGLPALTGRVQVLEQFDADLAGSAGGAMVGWQRTPLADAVGTVGGMLSAQWLSVWEYAGLITSKPNPADPATWDWQPAIQAAVDSGAEVVYFPGQYTYNILTPVVVDADVFLVGERSRRGSNGGAKLDNIGIGDAVVYSNTKAIYDCGIKQLNISSTTGHALNLKYGAVRCHFTQNYLYTRATNKSCVAGIYTAGTLGVDWIGTYSCVFEGGEFIVDNVTRTAPIIDFMAKGTVVNENNFRNIWLTQSKGIQAIRLMATVAGVYLTNNRFEGLTFEICSGGGFLLQATSHTKISGVSFWDMVAGYDGSLIQVSNDTAVAQNRGLLIENFARIGNALNGAAVDVDLGYSQGTTIINHAAQASANAVINFRGRSAVFIGPKNATVQNDAAVTYIEGALVTSPVYTTKAGNQFRDLSGAADLNAPAGTSGLSATNSGNSQRIYLDANTFFGGNGALLPATDNTLNLGHTSNRYKTVYAATGTINTSDARDKQQVREHSVAERAVALRLRGMIRAFKFNDAVALKGEAGARIHFGVLAQDVKAAFEAEGLVAEHYALLCYDEWPEQAAVVDDDGRVVTPYQPAGNRYGVRYDELLAFLLCAL
ncbi:tail fiber domain-containing protein [Pseudomonas sp. MBLB4136]|uniref:tail fiber domain-containing protein n=1 Tax=Pseudomonas sp. MBLB4136 TaxID=3451558 RepID=UPI003F75260B